MLVVRRTLKPNGRHSSSMSLRSAPNSAWGEGQLAMNVGKTFSTCLREVQFSITQTTRRAHWFSQTSSWINPNGDRGGIIDRRRSSTGLHRNPDNTFVVA